MADEGSSTPRGDAELVDFDELEKLESLRSTEEFPQAEEAAIETAGAREGRAAEGEEAPAAEERLSGPKQWEKWFTTHGDNVLQQEQTDREDFAEYIKGREFELVANSHSYESELAKRLQGFADDSAVGTRGALATVADGARRCPVADAVNASVLEIHALLAAKEHVEPAAVGIMKVRIATLEFLLSMALPCLFSGRAAGCFEELARLLRAPRLGLCSLIHDFFDSAKPKSVMGCIDTRFTKLSRALRKLLDCIIVDADFEDRWHAGWAEVAIATYYAVSWALTATDPSQWPEPVVAFKIALARTCNHTPGRGMGAVIRTSNREITMLLADLRAAFKGQHFQERYNELRRLAQSGDRRTHGQMLAMTWEVHKSVLPRYGFDASSAGVMAMFDESDYHADYVGERCSGDKVVAWLRMGVCQALAVDITQNWNFGGRKFEHAPQFHTVGDSHSTVGWPSYVNRHFQGPLLCYNVDRVDVRELSPKVEAGDAICFCFGEIDCRVQVHKRCSPQVDYQHVIDGIISRYFDHLRVQDGLLPAGVRVLVFNVPPPQYRSVLEHSWIGIPCKGEDEDRQAYVLYFNQRLKEECNQCGFEFFDVYDKYTDERGFLNAKYSDETIHISDGTFLDEFIKGLRLKAIRKNQIQFGGERQEDQQ